MRRAIKDLRDTASIGNERTKQDITNKQTKKLLLSLFLLLLMAVVAAATVVVVCSSKPINAQNNANNHPDPQSVGTTRPP